MSWSAVAQSPITSTPLELYGDHVFIKLSVDDSEPLDFIFDTGDGLTVIDLDVAKKLNLDLDHKQATTSAQGSITGALIKHNKVAINDLVMEKNIKVYATSLEHLEISIGRNVDGIIGYDLLRHHHVIRLDYDNSQLQVYDSGSFPKNGEAISFKLHSSIPTVTAYATLNNGEKVEGSFFVNTGAGTTMDFNTPFANANGIIDKTGQHYSYVVKGLGDKETKHYEGRVKSLSIGTLSFDNLPIGISQASSGIQSDKKTAGIIGNRILSRYNLTLDYHGHKMYFEERSGAGESFKPNCSGIDVQLGKDMSAVLIHQVYEGSPAADAGIEVDAQLLKVNGKMASDMSLVEIEKALKKAGENVDLVVKQGGAEKSVTLALKELI